MTKLSFTIDPDEMDNLIAYELRQCYESLATSPLQWNEREQTMDALLVVLDHYMPKAEYNDWYETIKEL